MYFKGKRYETSLVPSVWDETEVDRTSYCIKEPLAVEFCSRVILLVLYKSGMKDHVVLPLIVEVQCSSPSLSPQVSDSFEISSCFSLGKNAYSCLLINIYMLQISQPSGTSGMNMKLRNPGLA